MTDKEKEHIISIITVRRLLPCKVKSTKIFYLFRIFEPYSKATVE